MTNDIVSEATRDEPSAKAANDTSTASASTMGDSETEGDARVIWDDDGNPRCGVVSVTIRARVSRDLDVSLPEPDPDEDSDRPTDLQRRVAAVVLGADDPGVTLDLSPETRAAEFPADVVEAVSDAMPEREYTTEDSRHG